MSGTFSLGFKKSEECAPTGVHDGFRQVMVLDHVGDSQIFHHNTLIAFGIGLSRLEMMISTLAIDLQMGLGNSASGFTASPRPFLSPAQLALLASEGLLRGAIKAGVLDRLAFTIGQERLQPHIQTDIRMGTSRGKVFCLWLSLTDDEGVPMSIGSQDKMDRLGGSFHQAMHLDFEGFAQFGRNDEMFLILMQRDIFAILSQLNGMPLMALFKAREPNALVEFFAGQKAFEGFGESIGQGLHGGGWHMLPTTSLELGGQVILAWKRALLLILPLDGFKHLVINEARLAQALHEQMRLVLIHEKAIFVSPHGNILSEYENVSGELPEAPGRRFTPMSEAKGTHAAFWVAWLARQLVKFHQAAFYIERLQFDWLPAEQSRRLTMAVVFFSNCLLEWVQDWQVCFSLGYQGVDLRADRDVSCKAGSREWRDRTCRESTGHGQA